eukprot:5700055-Alexandrium_andersonii.AAC.1
MGPKELLVAGCWWLLREIEAANITLEDVRIEGLAVHLCLPASKTDPQAQGVWRAHRCACGSLPGAPRYLPLGLCPACAVVRQDRLVRGIWEICSQEIPGAMPLFPNSNGLHPQKHA